MIVCDKTKIQENCISGAPDLIVAILSKYTAKIDKMIKFNRYQRAGMKEYWIVDPAHETIDIYKLENNLYKHGGTYGNNEVINVGIVNDLSINLKAIFRDKRRKSWRLLCKLARSGK